MLRFLFFLILFYFIFRLFYRVFAKKKSASSHSHTSYPGYRQQPRQEGELHVDHVPEDDEASSQNRNEEGEFIDYEEIDDSEKPTS